MSSWTNVLTLFFVVTCANGQRDELYEVPDPTIIAFSNGGLRVTIPENPGIAEFQFHGNVNREIEPLRPGMINLATHQGTAKKWVLENRHTLLKRGDIVSYWISVKKDRLGYVRQPSYFQVRELVPYFSDASPPIIIAGGTTPFYAPESPGGFPGMKDESIVPTCNNRCGSVKDIQKQLDVLTKKVDMLVGVVEKLTNSRNLTLDGRIPQDENPTLTVRFVLWEKLDIKPNVVSAVRNKNGSITFEVETLQEKLQILNLARENLTNSKITIS